MFKKILILMFVLFGSCFFCFPYDQTNDNNLVVNAQSNIVISEQVCTNSSISEYPTSNIFKFKTLIIKGSFDASGYSNALVVDENTTILKFETELETEMAYNKLTQLKNISVIVEDCEEIGMSANYSHFYSDWGYDAIHIDPYMDYLETNKVAEGEEVVVVVIDTGINTSHQYLKDRILKNTTGNYVGFAATSNSVKVQTKYTYSGYEFEDDKGHGTHVAGIVCNSTPSNVKILPVKMLNYQGKFSLYKSDVTLMFSKIAEYSKTYNIACVNMSWGGYWNSSEFISFFGDCVDEYLIANNILPIASAGNDTTNANTQYPGALNNIVCVSALTKSGTSATLAYYSNYGTCIDISAPGSEVLSCGISSTNSAAVTATQIMSGTSMASPYVAAVTALLCLDPDYITKPSVETIRTRLYSNVTDLGTTGLDSRYGYGMVDLKYVLGNISYVANNTTVQYDGNYHNISVTNIAAANYSISYKFATESSYSSTITGNANYKNYTNGAKNVYFKITATGYKDTTGYATLTINKAEIGISISNQSCTYGSAIDLDNSKYIINSGQVYGSDSLGLSLYTDANNNSQVGSYSISANITNTNYNLTYTTGVFSINARSITISLSTQSSEYGDAIVFNPQAYIVTSQVGVVNNDNLNLQFTTSATSGSEVGEYPLTIVSCNSNYSISYAEGIYKITQKQLIVTSSQSGYYGDSPIIDQLNFTTNVQVDKQSLKLTLSTTASSISPVGNYAITFVTGNSNYAIANTSIGKYTVNKRLITITALNQTETYGNEINLDQSKYSITSGNIVNSDAISVALTTTATKVSSVGNYTINIETSGDDANNYEITKISAVLSINKRTITLIASNQSHMYGDRVQLDNSKFTVSNLANGDTLYPTLSTAATSTSPVGDYEITIECSSSNYNITTVAGNLEITPRIITIQIANQSFIFGEEIYLGNSYSVISQLKIVNNDNLNIMLQTTATKDSPHGTYPITLTYSNANYIVEIVEGTLTIAEKIVYITLHGQTGVYGEEISLDNTEFTINTHGVDAASLGITITTNATSKSPVGMYLLSATSTNQNLAINFSEAYFTINPRQLTLTIQNQTVTYGNVELDANAYQLGNIVNNDTVSISLATNATNFSAVAGNYVITATCLNSNYTLPETSGVLTIKPRELTISLEDQSGGYYGNISIDENKYTLSASPINNDELNIKLTTTATNSSEVGKYKIFFTYDNNNYAITGNDAEFTVNPRLIEISISQRSVYGDEIVLNPLLYSVTSVVKPLSGDDLKLKLTTTATKTSSPADYNITAVCQNNNYGVTINSATLTIVPRAVTITAQDSTQTHFYGNPVVLDQSNYTISNLANGDSLIVTLRTSANNLSPIGDYLIIPECQEDETSLKYEIYYDSGNLTISKREIEITIENQQSSYGLAIDLKPLYKITSGSIVNDDNLNIILKTDATNTSLVGFYDIWLEYNNNNYEVNVIRGQLEITQCDMVITIEPQSGIYGDDIKLDQTKFKINIEIDVKILGITLTTTATKTSPVGNSYEINLTYTNTNYDIVIVPASFEIKPRPISVNILNQTCTYGEISLDNSKFTTSESPMAEDFGIVLTTDAENHSNCGSNYKIDFTYSNNNYDITARRLGVLSVIPRVVEISTNQSSYYGNNVEVDHSNYSIVSGSIVNGDNLGLKSICQANSRSNVGIYSITFECENENYSIISKNATYEILARPISISVVQQKEYGADTSLDENNYEIISGNVLDGDRLDLVLTTNATKTDNVGEGYVISILSSNPNYNISLEKGQFLIVKRKLIISSVQNVTYGNIALDNDKYSCVEGEKAFDHDNLNIAFATEATNQSNVGEYGLSLTYNNDNYDISLSEENSKLIISPRQIIICLNPSTSIYGEDVILNGSYEITSGYIVNNDNLNLQLSTQASNVSNAGMYQIKCDSYNSNYQLTLTNNVHTIQKRLIKVKLAEQTSPHGIMFQIDQTKYEVLEGSIVKDTSLDLEIYSNAKRFAFIGKYDLMAKTNNSNYEVEVVNARLTLTPSVEDAVILIITIVVIIVVSIKLSKRSKDKKKNKELFDKYIGW